VLLQMLTLLAGVIANAYPLSLVFMGIHSLVLLQLPTSLAGVITNASLPASVFV
jgi:hypothetical protein